MKRKSRNLKMARVFPRWHWLAKWLAFTAHVPSAVMKLQ